MAEISAEKLAAEWILGSTADISGQIEHMWEIIRASFLAPMVTVSLYICLVLSTMLFVEWIYILVVVVYVKIIRRKGEKGYKWEAIEDDEETGNAGFPMVLVQIPLCNEEEVYKLSIGAACKLSWPHDRLLIQVLDDSNDILIKDKIEKECLRWGEEGINLRYLSRETRRGFKAGSLKEGLEYEYVKECEYVVVFDADFQPEPDFLRQVAPFLTHNPDIALVQARWRFVNADECMLTRLQEMSLDFHFIAEQEVGSSLHSFFGFNGTGGIWRIAAIKDAGGWKDRTTAEDMDLAVRAALNGWKFLYVGDLEVKSELPSTFKAFRSQQHRWFSGPTSLFRQIAIDIAKNKKVSLWKKLYMLYNFFFLRKIVGHTCIFFSYCVVLPLTILVPEVNVPKAGAIFMPLIITAINVVLATPRSLHLVGLWVLFEFAMSFYLTKAIFTGLLGMKRANEWLVTKKLGDGSAIINHSELTPSMKSWFQVLKDRILLPELGFAVFLFTTGFYGFVYRKDYYSVYLFLQAIILTIMGFGFFGKQLPS